MCEGYRKDVFYLQAPLPAGPGDNCKTENSKKLWPILQGFIFKVNIWLKKLKCNICNLNIDSISLVIRPLLKANWLSPVSNTVSAHHTTASFRKPAYMHKTS